MKATKVMSIIGIVLASLSFLLMLALNTPYDYEAAIGWGLYAALYLLAFSIVACVQIRKK